MNSTTDTVTQEWMEACKEVNFESGVTNYGRFKTTKQNTMIQPQELRIGNLVIFDGALANVFGYSPTSIGVSHDGIDTWITFEKTIITPIPITVEWLMKAGFEFAPDDGYYYFRDKTGKFILMQDNGAYTLCDIDMIVQPKYLHQLMNLYFALTGEELKIEI